MYWSHQKSLRSQLGVGENFPIVAVPMRLESIYSAENIPFIKYSIKEMAHDIVNKLISRQCIPCSMSYAPKLMLNEKELDY